jgi:hypothetical protein
MRSEQWQRHPVTYTWSPLSSSIHPLRSPSTRFSSQTAATQQRCLHPADTKASLPARAWRLRSRPESLPPGAGLPRPSRPKLPVTDEQAPTGRCSASTRPTSAPHTPADLHRFSCRLLRSVPFTSTPHRAGPHPFCPLTLTSLYHPPPHPANLLVSPEAFGVCFACSQVLLV